MFNKLYPQERGLRAYRANNRNNLLHLLPQYLCGRGGVTPHNTDTGRCLTSDEAAKVLGTEGVVWNNS